MSHKIHSHEMLEKTLILCKHDAVQRGLVGEIVKRFEQRGMKIIGLKLLNPTEDLVGRHYADDQEWKLSVGKKAKASAEKRGDPFPYGEEEFGNLVRERNMASLKNLPIVAIVFEGFHACEIGRKLVGATAPLDSLPGTIRGDYTTESLKIGDVEERVVRNLVHASGNKEEAANEIKVWFKEEELINYQKKDWEIIHSF